MSAPEFLDGQALAAGVGAHILYPVGGEISVPHSGDQLSVVTVIKVQTLIECHERSFAAFGGVSRGNMKTVILERDACGRKSGKYWRIRANQPLRPVWHQYEARRGGK